MSIAKNWSLHYRNLYEPRIKRLTERYRELYDENQMMKKRLEEYEGNKRMVLYYNKKEQNEST
jgi:acyl-[acyl carrier protein]--UDP-N-acetylglucosamine O-acyltransferase